MSVWRKAISYLRPPEKLSPSEWAEKHIRIPQGNAIPGLIRFGNAPYQREPLDMVADPDCRHITLMWGAQVGKTQVMNCAIGYHIAHKPQSQMMMQPSQGDLQTWLETKFQPLVDGNDVLGERIAKVRGRQGVNNQRLKSYPGGFLMFAWAGSPRTMRGRSAPKICCDEVDGYQVTAEGHPVSLLWQRAATFGDQRLLIETSTPTIKNLSKIESSFTEGDQRRYWIPCPHCDHYQTLKWSNVHWQKDPDTGEHQPWTALYHCEACGCGIDDGQKIAALKRGQWRAEKPFRGHASYHLSELYSAFRRWRDIVESFLEKRAHGDMQTFVNVSLAETWEEQGEQADPNALQRRAVEYPAQVPAGGVYLTAGIDMQMDRLEVEVVAWGVGEESWSIEHRVLWGDPLELDVWSDLDDYLTETWVHESGAVLGISASCLDTGGTSGYPQAAYEYARTRSSRRLFAVKGVAGWGRPIVAAPGKRKSSAKARKVNLFPVGVDEAKLVVMRRLTQTQPGPGYCHFPDGRDVEYYQQLTAERLVTRYVKGHPIREWHKMRDRNEALDCRVYAMAALKLMNPNLKRLSDRMVEEDGDEQEAERPVTAQPKQAAELPPEAPEPRKRQGRVWQNKKPRRR